jgi:hypothetical protein
MCLVAVRVGCAPQPNLSGTVLDQVGAVIADADIDLYSEKHEWHTTTDGAGRFSFPVLLPGLYDVEVTRPGFRKQVIQNMRISSAPAPMSISMRVASPADSCVDSLSRNKYVDAMGESGIRGVISAGSGATVSVLRSGSESKRLTARANNHGEFDFTGLEPGLYLLRASRQGYADFAVSSVTVRPRKTLQVDFSMQPSGQITVCQ